jgi:hypothetical protein
MKADRIRIARPTFEAILEAYASKTVRRYSSPDVVPLVLLLIDGYREHVP